MSKLLFILLFLVALGSDAQQLKVYQKDGTVVTYEIANIDSMVVVDKEKSVVVTDETIIGTWSRTETWNAGNNYYTESYTFKKDGTGVWKIWGTEQNESSTFRYSFNASAQEITFTQDGETWTDEVKFLSATSFMYDGGVFYRQ